MFESFKNFKMDTTRSVISFKPSEIAHLPINRLPGEAYGMGLIMPSEAAIENMVINDQGKNFCFSKLPLKWYKSPKKHNLVSTIIRLW